MSMGGWLLDSTDADGILPPLGQPCAALVAVGFIPQLLELRDHASLKSRFVCRRPIAAARLVSEPSSSHLEPHTQTVQGGGQQSARGKALTGGVDRRHLRAQGL